MSDLEKVEKVDSKVFEQVEVQPVINNTPELQKSFSLFSAIATGIVTGNTWTALGGAIVSCPQGRIAQNFTFLVMQFKFSVLTSRLLLFTMVVLLESFTNCTLMHFTVYTIFELEN